MSSVIRIRSKADHAYGSASSAANAWRRRSLPRGPARPPSILNPAFSNGVNVGQMDHAPCLCAAGAAPSNWNRTVAAWPCRPAPNQSRDPPDKRRTTTRLLCKATAIRPVIQVVGRRTTRSSAIRATRAAKPKRSARAQIQNTPDAAALAARVMLRVVGPASAETIRRSGAASRARRRTSAGPRGAFSDQKSSFY